VQEQVHKLEAADGVVKITGDKPEVFVDVTPATNNNKDGELSAAHAS
jgi:hypothetical protein